MMGFRYCRIVLTTRYKEYDKSIETFGTAVLSPIFKLFEDFHAGQSDLVAGAGRSQE